MYVFYNMIRVHSDRNRSLGQLDVTVDPRIFRSHFFYCIHMWVEFKNYGGEWGAKSIIWYIEKVFKTRDNTIGRVVF